MREGSNMKKILNIGEYIIIFLFGYLIFNLMITFTQMILYGSFGLLIDFGITYLKNCKQLNIQYIFLFIICFFINYSYNVYLVNKLNKSLHRFKERRS